MTDVLASGEEVEPGAAAAFMAAHDMIVPEETKPAYGALNPPPAAAG